MPARPPFAAVCTLLGVTALTAAPPLVAMGVESVRALGELSAGGPPSLGLAVLARTAGVAALIAALATLLAWPVAWALRTRGVAAWALVAAPLLMPPYLAYAGWGLLRAPGTWLGDRILRGPAPPADNWYPQAVAAVQAVLGLSLWCWPLAALVLAARLRRIDDATLDALALDAGPLRRARTVLRLSAGSVAAALAAAALVMLGSAVPLHVAQVDTAAIHLWRLLDQTPHDRRGLVVLAAWPLLAVAAASAAAVVRALAVDPPPLPEPPSRHASRLGVAAGAGVLVLAVGAPVALMATALGSAASVRAFVSLSAAPLAASLGVAAGAGAIAAVLAVSAWRVGASGDRRLVAGVLAVFLAAGLTPGVLVGVGTRAAWDAIDAGWARAVGDSWAVVVLAHAARFGFVAVLAGLALARAEPRELADLRSIDGGRSWAGFAAGALPPGLPIVLAAALAVGALSVHEIEATIVVEPASAAGGSFARLMLQQLHFNRTRELAAGVLVLFGVAGLAAALAAGLIGWHRGRAPRESRT